MWLCMHTYICFVEITVLILKNMFISTEKVWVQDYTESWKPKEESNTTEPGTVKTGAVIPSASCDGQITHLPLSFLGDSKGVTGTWVLLKRSREGGCRQPWLQHSSLGFTVSLPRSLKTSSLLNLNGLPYSLFSILRSFWFQIVCACIHVCLYVRGCVCVHVCTCRHRRSASDVFLHHSTPDFLT